MSNPIIPTVVKEASQLARRFNLQNVQIVKPVKSNYIVPAVGVPPDQQLYSSVLGTPVLIDLTFLSKSYSNEYGQVRSFPDITLETVLLSVSQAKEIVKTKIQGRKGTVKEYMALGDYDLTISAIICGTNGVYPRSDMTPLVAMLECNEPIAVVSWYLNHLLGITNIVIDSYDINQDEGQYSYQAVSIKASSDEADNISYIT